MARRGISFGVITCLGLSIFSAGTAEANRLVFTNEGDGNAPIDQDLDGDDNYELIFGDNLAGTIEYDQSADTFNISAATTVGGDLSTTGALDVQGGDITLQNDETISNSTDGTIDLTATTVATSNDLTVGNNAVITGTTDAQGAISDSTGNLQLNDAVDITGALDAQGDIANSRGDVTVNDNLDVTGTSDLQGNVSNSTGNLTLDDAVDVTGALDVQGGDITLENDETISNSTDGTIDITADNTNLSGDLDVQGGDITNSTGDINLDDNLNVTGTTSLDGNTTVETGATFTVTDGTSTFGGALDVNSTSDFGDDITLSADAQIINLRAQNAATGGAICADATDAGRIFYDTTLDRLYYCAETSPGTYGFVSTADDSGGTTFSTFYAEWENFSLYQDGSNNRGTIRSQYDDTDDRSYYYMTSRQGTTQDLDLVLQWQVPDDFTGFTTGTNHLEFDIETVGAGAQVDLRDVQVNGADQAIADLANTAAAWATQSVDLSGATVVAGDTLTLRFTLYGDNTPSESRISNVKLNYDK